MKNKQMITLPEEELKEMYIKILKIINISVIYNSDQLTMAEEAIRKMRKLSNELATYLWVKGIR